MRLALLPGGGFPYSPPSCELRPDCLTLNLLGPRVLSRGGRQLQLSIVAVWLFASGCTLSNDPREFRSVPVRGQGGTAASESPQTGTDQSVGERGTVATTKGSPTPENLAEPEAAKRAGESPAEDPLTQIALQLDEIGIRDPQAKEQLLSDLRKIDPSLWPQMLSTIKATLAYRRKSDKLEAAASDQGGAYAAGPARREAAPAQALTTEPGMLPTEVAPFATLPASRAGRLESGATALETDAPASDQLRNTAGGSSELAVAGANNLTAPANAELVERVKVPANGVVPASYTAAVLPEDQCTTFAEGLHTLILKLEAEISGSTAPDEQRQVQLRMLYLMAERREDALRPVAGLSPAQQDFWNKQLYGLGTMLDVARLPDSQMRAAEASLHFNDATARLRDAASLFVRNMNFCTEVSSYGVYKPFDEYVFHPGQEVLLYAEVENFKSERTADGYKTTLNSRYQIFDKQGQQVEERDFGPTEEVCRNRRRDFFIRYQFVLPKRIYDGTYQLKLTVEDDAAHKLGQSSVDFTIKESTK